MRGMEKSHSKPSRLIVFSDMLQHSDLMSHYKKPLPTVKQVKALPGYAEMDANLRGVDVWIFYVRRSGLESRQTNEHYYWWPTIIESLWGGRLMKQVPL